MGEQSISTASRVRDSSIELFRIITMFIIVAHHYVVNSELIDIIKEQNALTGNSLFLLLFGWGGKTGINCFLMITGYFMCKSKVTLKKFLKLLLQIEFYKIAIYAVFVLTGYTSFSLKAFVKTILPFTSLGTNFIGCFLVFYLFIPFLNILIQNMTKKQHLCLIVVCLGVFTILPTLLVQVTMNYVTWFMVIYLIAAYIRIYPNKWFESRKACGVGAAVTLSLSLCSVVVCSWLFNMMEKSGGWYFFVSDSNKILAVATAVFAFLFFKNLKIPYNKVINSIAASAFGVLLIHANSETMRIWLWKDTLNNGSFFDSDFLVVHAFVSVLAIYVICTLIDMVRLNLLEKNFFKWFEKRFPQYK